MKNMAKITYEDKETLYSYSDIPEKNKGTADNWNEVKRVVNDNDDNTNQNSNSIGNLTNLNTTSKNDLVSAINEVNDKHKSTILFENSNGISSGQINLSDDYTNYEKIDVITNLGGDKSLTPQYQSIFSIAVTEYYDTLYQTYLVATFSGKKLTINVNGSFYQNTNHTGVAKIFKVIGYKK